MRWREASEVLRAAAAALAGVGRDARRVDLLPVPPTCIRSCPTLLGSRLAFKRRDKLVDDLGFVLADDGLERLLRQEGVGERLLARRRGERIGERRLGRELGREWKREMVRLVGLKDASAPDGGRRVTGALRGEEVTHLDRHRINDGPAAELADADNKLETALSVLVLNLALLERLGRKLVAFAAARRRD